MKIIFEKKLQVQFGDVDPQGILYFARIFEFAHACLEEYVTQSELGWNFWFNNQEFAAPLKNTSCDFIKPMKAGEFYKVQMILIKLGESSVAFGFDFKNASGDICASVSTLHVFVNKVTFRKVPAPKRVLNTLGSP